MRKFVSFVLIWVFLFNVTGYYGVYASLTYQARSKANVEIDNHTYDQTQTVTIKIPLSVPYLAQATLERTDDDFVEYQGEFYELVERKYEHDTLYVICLRNNEQKKAEKVLSDFASQSTDSSPSTGQSTKTMTGLVKDYNPVLEGITLATRHAILLEIVFASVESRLPSTFLPVPTPPPNALS